MTSSEVRSLGIVLSFTEVGKHDRNAAKYSQSSLAATFHFGYVPISSWVHKTYGWHPNSFNFRGHNGFVVAGEDGINQYFKTCVGSQLDPAEVEMWKSHVKWVGRGERDLLGKP